MSTPISTAEIDGRIQALTAQRNEANDRVVLISGALAALTEKLNVATAKIAELEKQNGKHAQAAD